MLPIHCTASIKHTDTSKSHKSVDQSKHPTDSKLNTAISGEPPPAASVTMNNFTTLPSHSRDEKHVVEPPVKVSPDTQSIFEVFDNL